MLKKVTLLKIGVALTDDQRSKAVQTKRKTLKTLVCEKENCRINSRGHKGLAWLGLPRRQTKKINSTFKKYKCKCVTCLMDRHYCNLLLYFPPVNNFDPRRFKLNQCNPRQGTLLDICVVTTLELYD